MPLSHLFGGTPTWVTTSSPTTATTSVTTITGPNTIWWANAQTASTWHTATSGWTNATTSSSLYDQQALYMQQAQQQAAYERYAFGSGYQPLGLGSLFIPSRPAIITHQEHARRDRELYSRAIAEHDEQEAARLLRQIEAREVTLEGQRRAMEEQNQRAAEEKERRTAARQRARELLFEHLTPAQRETFDANGWFIVEGGRSKTRYRIRAQENMVANVDVLSPVDQRHTTHRLCAHVQLGTVPLGDQLLAQKIMIELAEDDFLRTANRHAA